MAKGTASPDRLDLVNALNHEIANLLAAARMQAHLINADASAVELASSAAAIGGLSLRMGSLLAQIGPLLSSAPVRLHPIDPSEVLRELQRDIEESCEERVRFDTESAAGLPSAAIDPDPLHHILLTLIYQALEESEPAGAVAVAVSASGESLVFAINGDGPVDDDGGTVLCGRTLAHAVADAILRERGGQIEVRSSGDHSRIEVTVPI